MNLFNLSVYLSILAVSEAAVKVVTKVQVETVYANGETPSSSVYSSLEPSSAASSEYSSSEIYSYSVDVPTFSSYQEPIVTSSTPTSTYVPPTTTSTSSTPTTTSTSSSPTTSSPTTFVTKTSSSSSSSAAQSTSTGGSISGNVDKDFAEAILDAHNQKRSKHSVPSLEWDDKLYKYAADYASSYDCSGNLQHSGGKYGENLAVGYSSGPSALEAWYEEGNNYDYSLASSFDHFTQVIWKSTTKVGCAYKDCSAENWGKYIICSYDPAGNMVGAGKANLSA